jgi:deoxyinosine 3'endonuclease (endonuclease V)
MNAMLEDPMWRVKERWRAEVSKLRPRLVSTADVPFASAESPFHVDTSALTRVAGVDVCYRREFIYNSTHAQETAVACLAVLAYPSMAAEWVDCEEFVVEVPYVPGFLAFRESPAMKRLIARCPPQFTPDVVLVDGNGALHPDGFGLACHLGVECGVPTVGVAKDLHCFDGLDVKKVRKMCDEAVRTSSKESDGVVAGSSGRWPDAVALVGDSGTTHGAAVFGHAHTGDGAGAPVFVSGGHQVDLDLAIQLTRLCRLKGHKTPEPIRVADARSRARVRLLEGKGP